MNKIPLSDIVTKSNVRKTVNTQSKKWAPFVENIKTHGLIQPIVCYQDDNGKYVVIAGHRRLKAIQELDYKNVDIIIRNQPNGDLKAVQISENIFREDLTKYEEVIAFKEMVNGENTIQEVADKYGCSYSYVRKRLQLSNLLPILLKDYVFNDEHMSDLKIISSFHPNLQKDAYQKVKGKSKKSNKEYLQTEHWASKVRNILTSGISYDKFVEFIGGEDTFTQMKKEFGVKNQRSLGLFDEIVKEQYITDKELVVYCIKELYPEVFNALMEVPEDNSLNSWDNDCYRTDYTLLKDIENRDFDGNDISKNVKNHIKKINMINFPFEFIIKGPSPKSNSTKSEKVERGKYYGQTKKFAKVTIPDYVEYLKLIADGSKMNDDVFKLINKQCTTLSDICTSPNQHGFSLNQIFDEYDSSLTLSLSDWVMNRIESNLVNETIYGCTIDDLNKLAKIVKAETYKEWFYKTWDSKDNEEFRRNVWSCFTTKSLLKIQTGKKSDIVEYAVIENKPFCFKDIFTSKENHWRELSVKYAYLDRATIYN